MLGLDEKGPGTVGSDKFGFGSLERKLDLVDQCQRDPSFMCASHAFALGCGQVLGAVRLRNLQRKGRSLE